MGIKHVKRSIIVFNIILYLLLSYFYFYATVVISKNETFFDYKTLKVFIYDHYYLLVLLFLTALSVFNVKQWSKYLLSIYLGTIFINSSYIYFITDIKLILVIGIIFFIISFYLFLLWIEELQDVIYHPCFKSVDIERPYINIIHVIIKKTSSGVRNGHLTNWDSKGCFINLDKKLSNFKETPIIDINFEGIHFAFEGVIVSSYDKGIGIKFIENKNSDYGWNDFFDIVKQRGYKPITRRV